MHTSFPQLWSSSYAPGQRALACFVGWVQWHGVLAEWHSHIIADPMSWVFPLGPESSSCFELALAHEDYGFCVFFRSATLACWLPMTLVLHRRRHWGNNPQSPSLHHSWQLGLCSRRQILYFLLTHQRSHVNEFKHTCSLWVADCCWKDASSRCWVSSIHRLHIRERKQEGMIVRSLH